MRTLSLILGILCCLGVVLDAFQTIILPRRPSGRLRITRLFYIATWIPWTAVADSIRNKRVREQIYSIYGPLSLLILLGVWAALLTIGFALIYFGLGTAFADSLAGDHLTPLLKLRSDLYVSGTTLFTLGLGDVTPHTFATRFVVVTEAGTGLGFVALVIGYLPVIYQAFSRREVSVALLDGRAGSPPTAAELLRRHGFQGGDLELIELLREWERWAAELLESHISYPILCYYRSQHDNQSWLSALVAILDACALLITTVDGPAVRQAQLTFAMARHAVIDLGHVFHVEHRTGQLATRQPDRLPPEIFNRLCSALGDQHLQLCADAASESRLTSIRQLYEPQAQALAAYIRMPLPHWIADPRPTDMWKKVADLARSPNPLPAGEPLTDPLSAAAHISDLSSAQHLHNPDH